MIRDPYTNEQIVSERRLPRGARLSIDAEDDQRGMNWPRDPDEPVRWAIIALIVFIYVALSL